MFSPVNQIGFRFDFKNFTLLHSKSSQSQSTAMHYFTLFREQYTIKVENGDFIVVKAQAGILDRYLFYFSTHLTQFTQNLIYKG